MSTITINGGTPLHGELTVQGAKNSVLPILAATILCGDTCRIICCPHLSDVDTAVDILHYLGCTAFWDGADLLVDTAAMLRRDIPEALMRKMRSSVIFLGAILARFGEAELSYPGGCELGPRPIDLHIGALRTLGAEITESGGQLHCTASHMTGQEIVLTSPSVGATENAMLAACGADGITIISNAAQEPEIVDLQHFLTKLGAAVYGAGGSTITVEGRRPLHGCSHRCIGDRIVAATYLSAVAATGGSLVLRGINYRHLAPVTTVLQQAGCTLHTEENLIALQSSGHLRAVPPIRTSPHPGFPTDAQAVIMAALLCSEGTTVFVENMFENRYRHVPELLRMGADVRLEGRVAVVCGTNALHGATVCCTDLRGGAALVIAGLQAESETEVRQIYHICRGYENILSDLHRLGAHLALAETPGVCAEKGNLWQESAANTIENVPREGFPSSISC